MARNAAGVGVQEVLYRYGCRSSSHCVGTGRRSDGSSARREVGVRDVVQIVLLVGVLAGGNGSCSHEQESAGSHVNPRSSATKSEMGMMFPHLCGESQIVQIGLKGQPNSGARHLESKYVQM